MFKLPISYLDKSDLYTLTETVSTDLELTPIADETEQSKSMYDYLFQPKHEFAKFLIPEWKKQYTTNVEYLNETKEIVTKMYVYENMFTYDLSCGNVTECWNTFKNDAYFLEKYSYVDWDYLKNLNKSPYFLQFITFMNIVSPAISLFIPILLLIFPFLLLKLQRIPISFSTYLETLKYIAKNHFIGKTLFNMQSLSWDRIVYILFSLALYMLQIYNNVTSCLRFYKNIDKMNKTLTDIKEYAEYSTSSMKTFLEITGNLKSYVEFNKDVKKHCETLEKIKEELKSSKKESGITQKISENGYTMKCFYELYENKEYEESIRFSMGFEAYINNMMGVYNNYKRGVVQFADFDAANNGVCAFKKQYYPPLMDEDPVKNDCSLKKNIIISAPNKAGKTTILKTTTLNIIFTQQLGCGFYEACKITPYTHIHSYLNIPDTSGRDSLFQAESRRCKDILDIITHLHNQNAPKGAGFECQRGQPLRTLDAQWCQHNNDTKKHRHFCIFDELYSGTNPEEACKAGHAFLKYLANFPNVNFMLTTHYLSICKKFRKSEKVQNYKMEVNVLKDGNFEYTYKMKKGISKIKGAVRVLKDMNYPDEIIENIEKI